MIVFFSFINLTCEHLHLISKLVFNKYSFNFLFYLLLINVTLF